MRPQRIRNDDILIEKLALSQWATIYVMCKVSIRIVFISILYALSMKFFVSLYFVLICNNEYFVWTSKVLRP